MGQIKVYIKNEKHLISLSSVLIERGSKFKIEARKTAWKKVQVFSLTEAEKTRIMNYIYTLDWSGVYGKW